MNHHEIGNLLHQIIGFSDRLGESVYAQKIRSCAFGIDALLRDETHILEHKPMSLKSVGDLEGKKVLIVDDMDENRTILKRLFATLKCVVYDAESGTQAIAQCQALAPDIVTMDIMMQGMDGFEATRHIRTLAQVPYMIAVSAIKEYSKEDIALFDVWLPKPFTTKHILEALAPFLGTSATPPTSLVLEGHFAQETTERLLDLIEAGALTKIERLLATLPPSPLLEYVRAQARLLEFDAIVEVLHRDTPTH